MRRFFTDRTPPSTTDLQQVYTDLSPHWLRGPGRVETWLAGAALRDELVATLRGNVLELGIGAGDTLIRLTNSDHTVGSYTGIDLSPGMIAEATRAAAGADFPTTLLVGNAEDLGTFATNRFDTVTASMVFCTVTDVPRALAEIARVCTPEGRVVLLEHMLSTNRAIAAMQRRLAPINIRKIGCHIDRATEDTLRQCGYTIEHRRTRRWGVIRLLVARPPQ